MSQAVFAYGSLVSAESAAATLSRAVEPIAPAALGGWRRRWSLCRDNLRSEKSFALEPGGELPPYVLGLNLEPGETEAGPANGALLDVSEPELARLDQRELRYDRVDVTDQLEASERFDRVWTFTAKPEHHASEPPRGAVILTTYAFVKQRRLHFTWPGASSRRHLLTAAHRSFTTLLLTSVCSS